MIPSKLMSHQKKSNLGKYDKLIHQDTFSDQLGSLDQTISYLSKSIRGVEDVLKNLEQKISLSSEQPHRKESRFQIVKFPLEKFKEDQRKESIAIWCGKMAKQVFSVSFQKYYDGSLNEKQSNCYASQSFLYNFLELSKSVDLNQQELDFIDKKLKEVVLPFIKSKYPQSQDSQVNLSLKSRIQNIDDLENNENDLFYRSKVKLQLSEKKDYNSQIMEFLNYVIKVPSSKEKKSIEKKQLIRAQTIRETKQAENQLLKIRQAKEETLYKKFYSYFEGLFESLYSKQKVDEMGKQLSFKIAEQKQKEKQGKMSQEEEREKQKLKYKQKVQQYTKYLIGRKLSENIEPFRESDIKDGNLKLKNSALMRIVTKWCEQLRQYFKKPFEVAHKHGQFRMKDGSERYLCHAQSEILERLLDRKEKKINNWLESVRQNNFKHQIKFSKEKFTKDVDLAMLSEEESSVGMFASVNRKNYEFYLIGYIKELIHHILTVMDQFEAVSFYYHGLEGEKKHWDNILKRDIDEVIQMGKQEKKTLKTSMDSKTLNLLTFRVGDLLRCKCSSREREINALYNQIQRISKEKPEFLKVVRVKDRLERGTKDVLLNLLFQQKVLIEVQLAIDTNKSKFIDCSDKFNHYIYEVERAEFGPISELCSIWMNYDPRSNFFFKCFQERHFEKRIQKLDSRQKSIKGKSNFPFQCIKCKRYATDIFPGEKELCIHCGLEQKKYDSIRSIFPKFPKQEQNLQRIKSDNKRQKLQFPKSGLVLKLNSKNKQIKYFKCVKKGKQTFIMVKQQQIFRSLGEISSQKQKREFLEKNLVFTHENFEEKQLIKSIDENAVKRNFFIPNIFQQVKKKQKNSLRIVNEQLNQAQIDKINEPLYSVQKVNLSENNFQEIQSIAEKFPKAKMLILNNNKFVSVRGWQNLSSLQQLNLENNTIQDFEIQAQEKSLNLKKLVLNSNSLISLSDSFGTLRNLEILSADSNKLTNLTQNFGELINLEVLQLNGNFLISLPQSFGNLNHLKKLQLNCNKLEKLPVSFGELNIEKLYLNSNKFEEFPNSLLSLSNLNHLYFNDNGLKSLPNSFGSLYNVKILELNQNKLTTLPESFGELLNLEKLYLNDNQMKSLPKSILMLRKLQKLQLNSNQLQTLPEQFGWLENLQKLYLNKNRFITFPEAVVYLGKITTLGIQQNNLTQLPESFDNLKKLQKLYLNSNNLRELPTSILAINSLNVLNLDDNQLQSLPENLKALKNLKTLYLKGNLLSELPNSFGLLKNLQKVYLTKNNLRHLPESFRLLENLQKIYLSSNKFTEIPDPILSLNNLQTLDLKQNGLLHLPQSIKNLKKLQTLYLQFNKLETLPNSLIQLDNLQELQINENKLDEAGKKIYNKVKKFRVM